MRKVSVRNWWAFFLDYVFFGLGLTFANQNTILPAFASTLTDSKLLIGSVSAVWLAAWLLPQLFAANYLTNKPRKYHYMIGGSLVGRPMFWVFALLLASGWFSQQPLILLAIFLVGLGWFAGWDAFVAIAWFDLFGKAMTSRERGRLIGIGQVCDGLLAIGAGWMVAQLLSERGPAYPLNYAAIFALAGLAFFIALLGSALTVERHEAVPEHSPATSLSDYGRRLSEIWRNDAAFARVNVVRLLTGLSGLATPFYILHATQVAAIRPEIIGTFAAVGSIGVALGGLLLGQVAARRGAGGGAHRVIQVTAWLAAIPPALGIMLALIRPTPEQAWIYGVCYLITGMVDGSVLLGFFNYILDLAPPGNRPLYMGLANTLGGALIAAPILGGWVLDVSSYPVLFALTLIGVSVAAVISIGLPRVAHVEEAAPVHSSAVAD